MRAASVDFILQHCELVAAEAGDHVGLAHVRPKSLGDRAEELVADRVPERSLTSLKWSRSR